MATGFSGERSRREPPIIGKQLVNLITSSNYKPVFLYECLIFESMCVAIKIMAYFQRCQNKIKLQGHCLDIE